ncbi:hypothetical protein [Vibrio gazogenes]|nr:hypothetical protein [Vibrio gazogenes]
MDKEKLCSELFEIMNEISELLKDYGENPIEYRGLGKVKNIAKNRDPEGLKNISGYLDGDFRMIYDNRVSSEKLEKKMQQAYLISDKLSI